MNTRTNKFFTATLPSLFSAAVIGLIAFAGAMRVGAAPTADFDGDGKSDISVFRPSNGFWYVAKSSGGFSSVQFGRTTDAPVPGDYDGDRKTDVAVYRQGSFPVWENTWYVLGSSDGRLRVKQWVGSVAWWEPYTATPADYDGDGKTDLSVYRLSDATPTPGSFVTLRSSDEVRTDVQWGLVGFDTLVPADYDGDGKADPAVFRGNYYNTPVNTWFILQSSNGRIRTVSFGLSTDRLVPADYDGDGKADIAVFRPSNGFWYRINSRDNSFHAEPFGLSGDRPTPADYDGDGKTDIAVFRPSDGVWYLQRSTAGFTAQQFGQSGDVPIPNIFVR